jgi:hypothetical protein
MTVAEKTWGIGNHLRVILRAKMTARMTMSEETRAETTQKHTNGTKATIESARSRKGQILPIN